MQIWEGDVLVEKAYCILYKIFLFCLGITNIHFYSMYKLSVYYIIPLNSTIYIKIFLCKITLFIMCFNVFLHIFESAYQIWLFSFIVTTIL